MIDTNGATLTILHVSGDVRVRERNGVVVDVSDDQFVRVAPVAADPPDACEGGCCMDGNARSGVRVHVTGKDGREWGEFTYCAEAIKSDRDHGFTVSEVSDDDNE